MLELDLRNLSSAEIEAAVASHCSQFGMVTNLTVRLAADGAGDPVALVSMSTYVEFERVLVALGDAKFGSSVVIRVTQAAAAVAVSQPLAAPVDVARRELPHLTAGGAADLVHGARKPADILLVEDNPADVRMTREALKAAGAPHELHVVEDGLEAIAFLYQEGRFAGAPRPDLVLLDINIPKVNGHEVLLEIKSNERFKHIPVVVLTSSRASTDVRRSYQRNADCFVTKPTGLDAFAREIRLIEALLPR